MSQSLVWDYFTLHRRPVAECNLCSEWYHSEQVLNLEKHLTREHPQVITEIRENIRRASLEVYFIFDVGESEARCAIYNCIINIFNRIDNLKDHLNSHGINEHTKTSSAQKSTKKILPQPTAAEDNTSVNATNQLFNEYIQDTEQLKESLWGDSYNLIWRYFIPDGKPYAKCGICGKRFKGAKMFVFEQHLQYSHKKVTDEIQSEIDKEIRRFNLSPYLVFDEEFPRIRCTIDVNCIHIVNIFHGTKGLRDHLSKYHENICTRISVSRNNTDVTTEQIADEDNESMQPIVAEDNPNANADNQPTDPLSQNAKNYKELPWGNFYNLVWRYFKPDKKPYAICNICKSRYKGISVKKFEQHLLYCHAKLVDEIRFEIDAEIRRFNLSPHFIRHVKFPQVRCKVDNCIHSVNIFHGIKGLIEHLHNYHPSLSTTVLQDIPRNTTPVITESVAKKDNARTNVDPWPGPN